MKEKLQLSILPCGILCWVIIQAFQWKVGYEIAQLEDKHEVLSVEEHQLDLEIAYLRSASRIESLAKENMGLKRPMGQQIWQMSQGMPP